MLKVPPALKEKILERYSWLCVYCFDEADQIDHIIPRSYVATNIEDNLVACCARCNRKLSNLVFDTYSPAVALPKKQKFIRDWLGRTIKNEKRSKCPDCHNYFRPLVFGASLFLCAECNTVAINGPIEIDQAQSDPRPQRKINQKPALELPAGQLISMAAAKAYFKAHRKDIMRFLRAGKLAPQRLGNQWYVEADSIKELGLA